MLRHAPPHRPMKSATLPASSSPVPASSSRTSRCAAGSCQAAESCAQPTSHIVVSPPPRDPQRMERKGGRGEGEGTHEQGDEPPPFEDERREEEVLWEGERVEAPWWRGRRERDVVVLALIFLLLLLLARRGAPRRRRRLHRRRGRRGGRGRGCAGRERAGEGRDARAGVEVGFALRKGDVGVCFLSAGVRARRQSLRFARQSGGDTHGVEQERGLVVGFVPHLGARVDVEAWHGGGQTP